MEQLLLVTSCDSPAGIGASLRTHTRTNGWTDRRDVGNSILGVTILRQTILRQNWFCYTKADIICYTVIPKQTGCDIKKDTFYTINPRNYCVVLKPTVGNFLD